MGGCVSQSVRQPTDVTKPGSAVETTPAPTGQPAPAGAPAPAPAPTTPNESSFAPVAPVPASSAAPPAHSRRASVSLRHSSLKAGWHALEGAAGAEADTSPQPDAAGTDAAVHAATTHEGTASSADRAAGGASRRGSQTSQLARPSSAAAPTAASAAMSPLSDKELLQQVDAIVVESDARTASLPHNPESAVRGQSRAAERGSAQRGQPSDVVSVVASHPLLDELTQECAGSTLSDADIEKLVHSDGGAAGGAQHNQAEAPVQQPQAAAEVAQPQFDLIQPPRAVPSSSPPMPVISPSSADSSCAADSVVSDSCSGWLCPPERGLLRPCRRLVCVACSQRVVCLDGRRWVSSEAASYLFVRTYHPRLTALWPATEASASTRAYACQCAAANVSGDAVSGTQASAMDGSTLRWRCGGGHAREDAQHEEQMAELEQRQLRQQAATLNQSAHITAAQVAAVKPSAINFDDDDDDDDDAAAPSRAVPENSSLPPANSHSRKHSNEAHQEEINPFAIV